MLTIIGATYREQCLEPEWDQLFGSGFRGAAAVSQILSEAKSSAKLVSWVNDVDHHIATTWAEAFEFECDFRKRSQTISFQYDHGLSVPRIWPHPHDIEPIEAEVLTADNVLLFSMLENKGVPKPFRANAKSLVYDPQAHQESIPFSATGSKAEKLAIVANLREANAMAASLQLKIDKRIRNPFAVGRAILEAEVAQVVVIKNGAEGAFVITDSDEHHVASYKTQRTFKIGSGDVFSSVFAAYWLELNADPVDAAQRASSAVAYYCSRGGIDGLPIPADQQIILESGITEHQTALRDTATSRSKVYIAGPLFNFQQQWFIEEVRRSLEAQGVDVFSPYHDVGVANSDCSDAEIREIAEADIAGLLECDTVFAIVDGLDAGTLFELGYAVAKDIPVVAFGQCLRKQDLLMIQGSPRCFIYDDFPTAIYQAAWLALEHE